MIYLLVVSIRFLHKEKIYTRTLGTAGDLRIYEINPLGESVGEDHGEISSLFETPVSQCIPKHGGRVRLNHPDES
jgi:hypothetical protein